MEDAYLVPAILWLVQTILGTLGIRELDSWIRQAGLQDDIENLRSELEVLQAVASDAKGMALRSARLAKSLADLKRFLYDADDLVDELDYWRLRQQVEGVTNTVSISQEPLPSSSNTHNCFASDGVTQPCTAAATTTAVTLHEPEGMHEAAPVDHAGASRANDNIPPTSGRGKKRSKAWDDFEDIKDGNGKTVQAECRHCKKRVQYKGAQGTRVLITHVNSAECKNMREARPQPPSHSSCIDDATENIIPVAASNSPSRPRMGTNQESTQITAAITHPWSKDEISSRIREITHQLQGIRGDVTKDLNMLLGSHSGASSAHYQSTASDPCRRTSSLLQGKVYGRDAEKNSIINWMIDAKTDSVTVLPIVGIGGTGKTALAQFVYNDPKVQDHFDHIIWIWVSNIFDEMRISREMLDVVPREKHEGLCSLDKLQQVLKTHIESKRVMLILDDVWDDMNNSRLDLILAPFKSNNANGNAILVTTRYLSVAKRIGTTEPVVLRALGDADFWLLFKARAFRDEKYEGNLTNIGRKIAGKLKGNPLAAVTAGELLRVDLTVDHWTKILKEEDWKLLGLNGGIMSSLKLSYDQLPYHLHQCFSYCSIFYDNHRFLSEELVHMWISQGFVKQSHPNKRLEEIGMDYLAELVNLGYFEQVERKDFSVGSQNSYVVSGLMHDFARMVSRAECGVVDGMQYNDMLPTVQHLRIVFKHDQHGYMSCSSKFEEDLRNAVTSVRKLRTLVLIRQHNCSCFQSFGDIFQKAHDTRLLHISSRFADFNPLMCSSVNPTHLRYLKLEVRGDSSQVLSSFCHLQVLRLGSDTGLNVPDGMNNLVSLRHLFAPSIARIGRLTSLQTLNNFSVQDSNDFQILELQPMNDLAQLGISQLQNVKTREEACGAGLRYKRHLEKLHLSWNMSDDKSDSDDSNECENVTSYERSSDDEYDLYTSIETEVLEGLEPHNNLKHLQITGYNGATSPSWLACNISVTCLQTLYLNGCGEWQILPSLEGLPFLAKLSLSNMPKVKEVSVPSLEELVLIKMPKLKRCSCVSLRDLNSCLRVLMIKKCHALKVFDLFGNGHKFKTEQESWLPRLCELTLKNCRLLVVPHPLPSSSTVPKISMGGVTKFPRIELSSGRSLTIGEDFEYYAQVRFDKLSDELFVLDGNILAFHNLRFLTQLTICCCRKLTSISLKGLSQLESLKKLKIAYCPGLSGFDAPPEHALPSLKYLEIGSCGIAWEWLSLILQHAPALTELDLWNCPKLESLQLNSCTTLQKLRVCECESLGTLEVLQSCSLRDMTVERVPELKSLLYSCTALEELVIRRAAVCVLEGSQSLRKLELRDNQYLESLQLYSCTALEKLHIQNCTSLSTLEGSESLRKLELHRNQDLQSLRLHSCTALEVLDIRSCTSLCTLDGFQSLGSLRRLYLRDFPGLHSCLEGLPVQDYELFPQLEFLYISGFSFLATSFCKQLTSLQRLVICGSLKETAAGLTDEQERGLLLLGSLTELQFRSYSHLKYLPAGLHRLRSLRVLEILYCPSISGLPDLPPSLEELRIVNGSEELKRQSRLRASSNLKVKIDYKYVN